MSAQAQLSDWTDADDDEPPDDDMIQCDCGIWYYPVKRAEHFLECPGVDHLRKDSRGGNA